MDLSLFVMHKICKKNTLPSLPPPPKETIKEFFTPMLLGLTCFGGSGHGLHNFQEEWQKHSAG